MRRFGVRFPVLLPFSVLLLLVIGMFLVNAYSVLESENRRNLELALHSARTLFDQALEKDSAMMEVALEAVAADRELRALFQAGERGALREAVTPLFELLSTHHGITRFQFLDMQRKSVLRVHDPDRAGDRSTRFTVQEAQRLGRRTGGLELGPQGTLTLRVVLPWRVDGRLIGYLEMAGEIAPLLADIRRILGLDLVVLVSKRFVDFDRYAVDLALKGRQNDWGRLDDWILAEGTLDPIPPAVMAALARGAAIASPAAAARDAAEVRVAGRGLHIALLPVADAGGQEVARLAVIHPVTEGEWRFRQSFIGTAVVSVLVGAAVFAFFAALLGRVERRVRGAQDELEEQVLERTEALSAEIEVRKKAQEVSKETESRARAAERRLADALEALPASVVLTDPDDDLILANRMTRDFFPDLEALLTPGTPYRVLLQANAHSGLFPESLDREADWIAERQAQRRDLRGVFEQRLSDGRWLEVRERRTREGGIVGTRVDVTARKRTEENLRRTVTALIRANTELEGFARVASMDLNEAVRMVVAYVQLLERRYGGQLGEDGRELIGFAADGARRIKALTEDLTAYSRIASEDRPLEPVDFGEVLAFTRNDLDEPIRLAGAVIEVGPLPSVVADRFQMGRLMHEMIGNALEHRAPDRAPVIRVSAEAADDGWRFEVADNGPGFEAEYAERVFEPFRRLQPRRTASATGMGLAIARAIVEGHGGRMWAVSSPGKGSTFCFILPIGTSPPDSEAPDTPDTPAGGRR